MRFKFALSLLLVCPLAFQHSHAQASGYAVTGRMICADTQRAARFAQVTLLPAGQEGGRRLSARTDLEGNFMIQNVPAGDYYAAGALPGYVNQTSAIQAATSSDTAATALAGIPLVHVAAGGASTTLSLQRGGTLAGTVTWDDGTPAAGVGVSAQAVATANGPGVVQGNVGPFGFFGGGNGNGQTDDRGRFRLSGLAPGSYYVRASVQAPAPQRPGEAGFARNLTLSVYAPNKIRRTDAVAVTVASGEERADLAIVIGLAGLHTVAGSVSASAAAVRSGSASLTDQTDSSLNRNVALAGDGSFTIPYVPPGTYTLRISASSQIASFGHESGGSSGGSSTSVRFQPMQESITVTDTDLTGLAVTVTQATAASQ